MMKENIMESIFYRFNPYFPNRMLPKYDTNPADPLDMNVKLGKLLLLYRHPHTILYNLFLKNINVYV